MKNMIVWSLRLAFVGECDGAFFLGGGGRKGGKQNQGPKIKTTSSCFLVVRMLKKGSLHMNLYDRTRNFQRLS